MGNYTTVKYKGKYINVKNPSDQILSNPEMTGAGKQEHHPAEEKPDMSQYYIWRTRNDDRVRSRHAEREGQIFHKDDPPEGGHPGEDFGCRCEMEPIPEDAYLPPGIVDQTGLLKYKDLFEHDLLKDFNRTMADENRLIAVDEDLVEEADKIIEGKKTNMDKFNETVAQREKVVEDSDKSVAKFIVNSREVPVEGRGVYYVSRPLFGLEATGQSHNFLVINADYLGDEKATVVSFGEKENGNLGRVFKDQGASVSKSTQQDDEKYWNSPEVREGHATLMSNNSRLAGEVIKKAEESNELDYFIFGPNSNSAAQAIAERIYHEEQRQGPVAPPDGGRDSTGAEDSEFIKFN